MKRTAHRRPAPTRRQHVTLTLIICVLGLCGLGIVAYPFASQWISAYNQSLITGEYGEGVKEAKPDAETQLEEAEAYNSRLSAGAEVMPRENVASGVGTSTETKDTYWDQLSTTNGTMSRLQIEKIGVDLPIYHGTSDAVLLKGAGHLQGTSLPVGGESTHSVITGHRGLAGAKMFTDLDQIVKGDRFVITTFGRVMTYKVIEKKVVDPQDTASLRQQEGEDLVTLITCTPLGINTQRILVTAERVTPTPAKDLELADDTGDVAFPWWIVGVAGGLAAIGFYGALRLRTPKPKTVPTPGKNRTPEDQEPAADAERPADARQAMPDHTEPVSVISAPHRSQVATLEGTKP